MPFLPGSIVVKLFERLESRLLFNAHWHYIKGSLGLHVLSRKTSLLW
jgi:hypothetical protein